MRVFDHPNMTGNWVCPICGTKDDKPVVLVSIDGTGDGRISEALQTHMDCLSLRITRMPDGGKIIYQLAEY